MQKGAFSVSHDLEFFWHQPVGKRAKSLLLSRPPLFISPRDQLQSWKGMTRRINTQALDACRWLTSHHSGGGKGISGMADPFGYDSAI